MRVAKESGKATMGDVARHAGVSVATVSRVINSTAPVSDPTARRVRSAVRALGYEINHVAKSLRQGATHTVAIIVADIGNPFYADFIKGVESAAQRARFSIMVCTAPGGDDIAQRQVQMLLSKRVDGVIMWGWCLGPSYVERLISSGTRLLGIELQPERLAGARSLSVDFRTGMGDVIAHLASLGHRNIAYLWDRTDRPATPESRFFCFKEAVSQHGLEFRDEWVAAATGGQRPEIGQAAVLDLLHRTRDITAIVCHNDLLALGALQAAKQTGLSVPERLSVVGVDDIFTARFTDPALTTLAIPRMEAGSLALQWLLQDQAEHLPSPQVTPRLVVRQSTGPVLSSVASPK
ncbi:MAG: LacI family DNA-binding transcriptional regulator [Armatimonadota bacterium]|nr:MAG: LacI family DNA-binding transcriptional regulator [Armatimonadota bacterium]